MGLLYAGAFQHTPYKAVITILAKTCEVANASSLLMIGVTASNSAY